MALAVSDAAPAARRAAALLLAVQAGQAFIGFVQYATDVPEALVATHMLGAGLLVVATTRLVLTTRERPATTPARRCAPDTQLGAPEQRIALPG
jgi:cytochrome c oxidase assembly protein subunit 15